MKRALVVSAGTVAGLVVSLSYTPGLQLVVAAGAPPKHGAKAQGKADASLKAVEQASRTGEGAGAHPGRKNDKAPSSGNEKGSSRPKQGTSTQPARSGADSAGTSSLGAGTSSSGTGDKPADNGSKPKPSASSDPKPSPKPSPSAEPKTFTGQVVSTAFGPVQVSIVVLSGRITDVATLQSPSADPRSVEIAKNALPILRSEALTAQSAQIAAVSGATYTSKGWISSLQSALVKAGL